MMKKFFFLFLIIAGCSENINNQKPNILFIMSDDHAKNAISIYGSRLAEIAPTPNIDRIAKEGVLMHNVFVTNSICTPSRAAILTGQYSQLNGVYTLKDDFDNSSNHLGKLMQKAGYSTAVVGKWHLHTEPTGFDYYNVLPGQGLYNNPKLIILDEATSQLDSKSQKIVLNLPSFMRPKPLFWIFIDPTFKIFYGRQKSNLLHLWQHEASEQTVLAVQQVNILLLYCSLMPNF